MQIGEKHPGVSEYHVTDIQTGRNVSGGNYPENDIRLRFGKLKSAYYHYLMNENRIGVLLWLLTLL